MLHDFDWLANAARQTSESLQIFSDMQARLLSVMPPQTAIVCVCDTPPKFREYHQDPLMFKLWNQFPRDCIILFDLPGPGDVAKRIEWNFKSFLAHCQSVKELSHIQLQLTDPDYTELAKHGECHILADVDDYCRRVHYNVVALAVNSPDVVYLTKAFCQGAMTVFGKEQFLASKDVTKEQWPYNESIGRQHPVFGKVEAPKTLASLGDCVKEDPLGEEDEDEECKEEPLKMIKLE